MNEKPKRNLPAEIAGWYGMTAIVLAYLLVSFNSVPANGWVYQSLNLTGSVGILVISLIKRVRQVAVLNLIWTAIALLALLKIALR